MLLISVPSPFNRRDHPSIFGYWSDELMTTRKPRSLYRTDGSTLPRNADRQNLEEWRQPVGAIDLPCEKPPTPTRVHFIVQVSRWRGGVCWSSIVPGKIASGNGEWSPCLRGASWTLRLYSLTRGVRPWPQQRTTVTRMTPAIIAMLLERATQSPLGSRRARNAD